MIIATQVADRIEIPEVSIGAVAPEVLLTGVALLLLGLAVGHGARIVIGGAGALVAGGLGVWLLLSGTTGPGAALVAVAAGALAAVVAFDGRPHLVQIWIAAAGLVGALAMTVWQWSELYVAEGARTFFSGAIALDGVAIFARGIIFIAALLVLPVGYGYLQERGIYRLEFEPLLLFSVIGMTIFASAGDLLIVFLGIELLSFPLYIMAGMARRDRRAQEAALKYFLTGAIASAVLLYGIALVYIATGTVEIGAVADGVTLVATPFAVVLLAIALMTVGLAFKAAAVPFHFWTPDVYQGSPTNVTAFMAAATKAAAFAVLLRVFLLSFGQLQDSWVPVLAAVAALTMLLGAIAAIVQRDVKRVLAYSSIAHVGYALVGVTSGSITGLSATLFYLLTYAVSAIAAFACVVAIERRRRGEVALIELKGLGRRSPVLSGIFGLSLLSLAGIPATAGFTGKFAVFRAGVEADLVWLVVVGVISSVIAAFFYLRLMGAMFLEDPDEGAGLPILSTGLSAAIALAAAAVVVLGILPEPFAALADQAASIAR